MACLDSSLMVPPHGAWSGFDSPAAGAERIVVRWVRMGAPVWEDVIHVSGGSWRGNVERVARESAEWLKAASEEDREWALEEYFEPILGCLGGPDEDETDTALQPI